MTEPVYRRPAHNGDEQDAFSRSARRVLCPLQRAGIVHKTKTRAARRTRHAVAQDLRTAARTHASIVGALVAGRLTVERDVADLLATYDAMELAAR